MTSTESTFTVPFETPLPEPPARVWLEIAPGSGNERKAGIIDMELARDAEGNVHGFIGAEDMRYAAAAVNGETFIRRYMRRYFGKVDQISGSLLYVQVASNSGYYPQGWGGNTFFGFESGGTTQYAFQICNIAYSNSAVTFKIKSDGGSYEDQYCNFKVRGVAYR